MLLDDLKAAAEKITGIRRPAKVVPRPRKAHPFRFADDGHTPNNPHLPLLLYRSPVPLLPDYDPAAMFETLFDQHGWRESWRDGIYPFLHFHSHSHEVLGIARGSIRVRFGGNKGRVLELRAGDVVILPAGTGHQRMCKSADLLVVGAYPRGGKYDEPKPDEIDHDTAVRAIAKVGVPASHPVYGGSFGDLWSR